MTEKRKGWPTWSHPRSFRPTLRGLEIWLPGEDGLRMILWCSVTPPPSECSAHHIRYRGGTACDFPPALPWECALRRVEPLQTRESRATSPPIADPWASKASCWRTAPSRYQQANPKPGTAPKLVPIALVPFPST